MYRSLRPPIDVNIMPKTSRVVLPLLFAIVLIACLVVRSGLSLEEFVGTLSDISPCALAGIVICTALFVTFSALKWRLVMSHMISDQANVPRWSFSLYYTSVGALLSLVITPHAAMPLSRSFGTKVHSNSSAIASAGASAYEQLFDVVPLLTMSLTALAAMALRISFAGWFAAAVTLNCAALFGMILVLKSRFWLIARFVPLPHRRRAILQEKFEWFSTPAATTLLGAPFVATLFAISLVRYAIILLRTAIVVASIGFPIGAFQFVKAYGIARLSSIISITPGELGISEWTWSGVLNWMGFQLRDAARFVLVNRTYNIGSLLVVFGLSWLAFTAMLALCSDEKGVERTPIGDE